MIERKLSDCNCRRCITERGDTINGLPRLMCEMIVCPTCGDKRCVHAQDHDAPCAKADLYAHNSWVEQALSAQEAQPAEQAAQPVAWLCELAQEDGSVKRMFVEQDPDGLRFNDMGEPSPFRVTPLYAAPQAGEVERAVAEERELAVRVLADVLETSGANKLHQNREEDARTLLRLARETPNVGGEAGPRACTAADDRT